MGCLNHQVSVQIDHWPPPMAGSFDILWSGVSPVVLLKWMEDWQWERSHCGYFWLHHWLLSRYLLMAQTWQKLMLTVCLYKWMPRTITLKRFFCIEFIITWTTIAKYSFANMALYSHQCENNSHKLVHLTYLKINGEYKFVVLSLLGQFLMVLECWYRKNPVKNFKFGEDIEENLTFPDAAKLKYSLISCPNPANMMQASTLQKDTRSFTSANFLPDFQTCVLCVLVI